jgi:hypothetical protein
MLMRFRIKSINDIRETGYGGRLPDQIEAVIQYQKIIPRLILKQPAWSKIFMKKCYNKLTTV